MESALPKQLASEGIEAFCQELETTSGLSYTPEKAYLFNYRLSGLASCAQSKDYNDLTRLLKQDFEARRQIIEALVTSETFFFRDEDTFQGLPDLVRSLSLAPQEPLVIWSLGCATGQEAYSIMMALDEAGLLRPEQLRLIGVDISTQAVQRAREATYTAFEVKRGLSDARRDRYLLPVAKGFQVRDSLRAIPRWESLNMLEGIWNLPRPHIVFCRNVLIYFSDANKRHAMGRIFTHLRDGSYVILGNTENYLPYGEYIEPAGLKAASIYRKKK